MSEVIGVVGAGTMGAGIARLAAEAGMRTLVHDADPDAARRVGLEVAPALADLAPCELVIEAAPEDLELKRALFAELERHVAPGAVLASNTSSLLVSAIAARCERPERVVGMHFFNPPAKMRLVEIVPGERTSPAALAAAHAAAQAMGRHAIVAADGIGFIVNRCNRPFGLEALRIVQERLATVEQVDRIARLGGGFRMGPFELMDLVGLDVGFGIQRSFWEQSFGEPRWRPSPLMARQVASGRHGRKSGAGWYEYPPGRPQDPPPPSVEAGGLVVIAGASTLAAELCEAATAAGWEVATPSEAAGEVPQMIVDCGAEEDDPPLQGGPQVLLCAEAPLAALDPGGASAGFFALPPLGRLVELTRMPSTADATARAAERFFASLGRHVEWVGDAPGLVLGRIVCQLVNEACFALGEGVGSAADIDAGMELGLNHPRGPLRWGDAIGPVEVLTVLGALFEEYREDRYRPAPALLRAARADLPLVREP